MINTTDKIDENINEEKKVSSLFFSQNTQNSIQDEFTASTEENDDITPFYVLGYN